MQTENKSVYWVTGASKGIGHAVVLELLKLGCVVAASARNTTQLDALVSQYPDQLACFPCDVTQQDSVQKCADAIVAHFGQLNTVIANAGTCEYVDVQQFDSKIFERVIQTNFMGLVYTVEAALPYLRKTKELQAQEQQKNSTIALEQRPYIVGMCSSVAWLPFPRAEAYGASKAASAHFLEALRTDLAQEEIDVSGIFPGFVKTPLTDLNDFPMPCKISSEEAAQRIIHGLQKRHHTIHFPKRFTLVLKFIACLPSHLRLFITKKMTRDTP